MSAAGSTLNAKVVLAIDANGMVVGADKSVAQMDRIGKAANDVGAAAEKAGVRFRSLRDGIEHVTGLDRSMRSAADSFAVFNTQGALTNKVVDDAAPKLGKLEALLASIGGNAGIAGSRISLLRNSIKTLPDLFRAMPGTFGAGVIVAGLAGAIALQQQWEAEIRATDRTVELYGARLGRAGEAARQLAADHAAALGISRRASREMLEGFVTGGGGSGDNLRAYMELVKTWAAATSQPIEQVREQIGKALRDPLATAGELENKLRNGVTPAIYEQVRALTEQGDIQQASLVLMEAWARGAKSAAENTSQWARDIASAKGALSDFWDAIRARPTEYNLMPGSFAPVGGGMATSVADAPNGPGALWSQYQSQRDEAQTWMRNLTERLDPSSRAFARIANEEEGVRARRKAGLIDEAQATHALNMLNEQRLKVIEAMLPQQERQNKAQQDSLDINRQLARMGQQAWDATQRDAEQGVQNWFRQTAAARQERDRRHEAVRSDVTGGLGGMSQWASPEAQALRYQMLTAEIERWRTRSLNMISDMGDGHKELADGIEAVFADRIAAAYEDDLRRRTDWASGIIRANLDITRSNQDMARRSEEFLHGWGRTGEDIFASLSARGKFEIGSLAQFVADQWARMAWQQNLAGPFNAVGGGLLNMLGGLLGGGSATLGMQPVNTFVDTSAIGSAIPTFVSHTGWQVGRGSAPAWRMDTSAAWDGAPRFHTGSAPYTVGEALQRGERRVIVQDDEIIATPQQWRDRAGDTIMLGGGAQQAPVIYFNLINQSGVPLRGEQKTKRQADGSLSMDVIVRRVGEMMAEEIHTGNSPVAHAMEGSYGLTRRPGLA